MPAFDNLLIVVAVAFAAPFVLGLRPELRLPSVVLEIVAGIIVGPSVLGLVDVDQAIEVIALVGLAFVLFLAGLEIEFDKLRGRVLRLTAIGFAASFGIALLVALGLQATSRLLGKLKDLLGPMQCHATMIPRWSVLDQQIPLASIAHNCGTMRFGADPADSVLDVDCKAHDLDNLYAVDTSCFPSSSAVNPALTAMANALRVGDHLIERLGAATRDGKQELQLQEAS